jgi:hypothetical protein
VEPERALIAASVEAVHDGDERDRLQAQLRAAEDRGPDALLEIVDALEADHPDALVCDAASIRNRIDDTRELDREEAAVVAMAQELHAAGRETPGAARVFARFAAERAAMRGVSP